MKDEIMEILDEIQYVVENPTYEDFYYEGVNRCVDEIPNYTALDSKESKLLLDYITNLQQKYDKVLELLVDFDLPCENDDFNTTAGLDYCSKNCSNDDEQYKKCWNKFIEWRLKDE